MLTAKSRRFFYWSILDWIVARPLLVLALGCAATVFFVLQIPTLSFSHSVYDLLIENLPDTARYKAFKTVFGSDEIIQVVIKADNIFDPATFRKVEAISEKCSEIKGVRRVISLPHIKKAVDPSGKWPMEEFVAVVAPVELFKKNLISADRKVTAVTLILENEAEQGSVIFAVNDVIAEQSADLALYQIGMPLVSQALVEYTIKDFQMLPVFTLLLIAVLLFILFRKPIRFLMPLGCVLIVLVWTLGFMALAHIRLSLLTMVVPVFLIAIGTAYCLHVMSEYVSSSQLSNAPREAVLSTLAGTALPCALAVLTTLFGLGSLFVNRIKAIHEFALSSCFGMVSMLVVILALLPAVLVLIPLRTKEKSEIIKLDDFFDRVLDIIVRLNLNHQKTTLRMIAISAILAAAGIFLIRIETNPVEYFKKNTRTSRDFHDIYQKLSGSFPINVVVESGTENYFENPEHLAEIRNFQAQLENLLQVDKALSFVDYLMLVNYALNHYDVAYYAIPQEAFESRMAINNYKTILGEDLFSRFMTPELNRANIVLLTHMSSSRDFLESREKILASARQHLPPHLSCEVTGFGMAISASSQLLTSGQINSLSIGLVLIFGIMFIMFLSAKVGLIAILPNIYPIIVNFGIMGWLGIRLSIATSLIASIAIGLAVDDTIHYLHRYNREFKKDLDKDRALRDTIKSVGKPIIFTTVAISIGFSILLFSNFKPTATFGFLMVVTMFFALVGDLLLLPALMLHVELVTAWDLLKLMPTLGGMPPGIAHELNQPLNAIKMGSEFLKMMISQREQVKEEHLSQVVNEISNQVDRASEIINRLRTFGQRADFAKEKLNINEPINDVIAILGRQLGLENISVQLDPDETLPQIVGNRSRLGQVVYNLVTNAAEAIGEKKKFAMDSGNHFIRIRTFREDENVALTISDSGIGIPEINIGRIYEPFFTTQAAGQGKGLGLSISHEIIRDLGGRIEVENTTNHGTTFKVTFPCPRS